MILIRAVSKNRFVIKGLRKGWVEFLREILYKGTSTSKNDNEKAIVD